MTFAYEPMLVRQGFGRSHTLTPAVSEEAL